MHDPASTFPLILNGANSIDHLAALTALESSERSEEETLSDRTEPSKEICRKRIGPTLLGQVKIQYQ